VNLSPAFDATAATDGVLGGILIGLAASLTLLGAGRIAGVSGLSLAPRASLKKA
jgi:uncharacterized membrane protein YedE/YeeE